VARPSICVSGGFDPLHIGHVEMFRQAAELGELTVIINSDAWLVRKKGFMFLPWEERAAIIGDLRSVAAVSCVDDADGTVCEALRRLRPAFFANGGDRRNDNTPEVALCRELGIELVWGMGGGKANSSSDIARRAWIECPWGRYVTLDEGAGYKVRKIVVHPQSALPERIHKDRHQYWHVAGPAAVIVGDKAFKIDAGDAPVAVVDSAPHRLANRDAQAPLVVIEVQYGAHLSGDDFAADAAQLAKEAAA
jgi:cytidyltransferase-like protein